MQDQKNVRTKLAIPKHYNLSNQIKSSLKLIEQINHPLYDSEIALIPKNFTWQVKIDGTAVLIPDNFYDRQDCFQGQSAQIDYFGNLKIGEF